MRKRSSNRTFARNLRRLRQASGLSQEEFAFESGLHRNYIGSIERAERNITFDVADRIAKALNVRVVDLLDEEC